MSEIQKFQELKADGKVAVAQLQDTDEEIEVTQKQFDPDTGTEVNPKVIRVQRKALKNYKKRINDEIERLKGIREDINAQLAEFRAELAEAKAPEAPAAPAPEAPVAPVVQ